MRVEKPSNSEQLRELRFLLGSAHLPVQEKIAEAIGVDQSMVSRAQTGGLRRMTAKVFALLEYARLRVGAEEAAKAAALSIEGETTDDLQPEPIVESRGRDKGASLTPRGTAADDYRIQALNGVETYLNDGYDPRLIVEQLAVLRRAQRVRGPGRPRSPTS